MVHEQIVVTFQASNGLRCMQANTLLQAEKDKELEATLEAATAKMREAEAGWACERESVQSQLDGLTTDLSAAQSKCKELEASKETCVPMYPLHRGSCACPFCYVRPSCAHLLCAHAPIVSLHRT